MAIVFILTFTAAIYLIFGSSAGYYVCGENSSEMYWCLSEASSGSVLDEYKSDKKFKPGSCSKLMIIYMISLEIQKNNLHADTVLKAGKNVENTKGSSIWLLPGDNITVDELLKAVITGNANDACITLADYFSENRSDVLEMMNQKCSIIGMKNTYFDSITGIDEKSAYTTASDMSELARRLAADSFLADYFRTWRIFIKNDTVELVNENSALNTYEGTTGLKAGINSSGEYFLIQSVKRDNMVCIAAVFGAKDKDERFSKAKEILKNAFLNYYVTTPNFSSEYMLPLTVKNGRETAVNTIPENLPPLSIMKGSGEISYRVILPDYIKAPVRQGQKVGTVYFYSGDTLLYQTPMCAENDIEKKDFSYVFKKMFIKMLKY